MAKGQHWVRLTIAVLSLFSLATIAAAQHSKTEKGGLYNFPYKGDIWTGEIVAFDQDAHEITLEYVDKKGHAERFTGRVNPGARTFPKDKPGEKISSLSIGDRITAYYVAPGQKYFVSDEHGKRKEVKATENLIFQIEVLPQKKQ